VASRSTEYRHRRAVAEGREYGVRPCARCGVLVDLTRGRSRRKYCDTCRHLVEAEWRKADRERRRESMRAYLRGYYRENREALLVKQKERREADIERTRAQTRAYYHRNLQKMRTRKREQYTRKNNPTVHERALEIYGFKSSDSSGHGVRIAMCKCGCGLPVNAAHIAVMRLSGAGYSRKEIADRLGVHPVLVSKLRLDGEARTWPWYRRGHSNLASVKPQPLKARRFLTRHMELRQLVEQQDEELLYPKNAGYKHMGRVRTAWFSLDAPINGTENATLADVLSSGSEDSVFEELEVQQAETLVEQLERAGFSIDQVTRWIEDDPSLATAFARSLDSGQLSKECLSLLAKHGASVAA